MRTPYYNFFLILFLANFFNFAQEIPPIVSYSTEDYLAENQNWSISQADNKFIYVANNKGLLEFNGATWQSYSSPNETIMRSVKVVGERIYTGCYMEFGFWMRDNYGKLNYSSLSSEISDKLIVDEQFWNILAIEDWILFQSFDRIYIYNSVSKSFKTIDSETMLTKMVEVEGEIYFQKLNKGVYKIVNGEAALISDNELLKSGYIVNVFKNDDELLIQTQQNGFFQFDGENVKKWNISSNSVLETYSVYNSIQLSDGGFALGTISNGVIFLNKEGAIDYTINQSKGLSNNTILSLYEDLENNIWLGLDNGIDCVNIESPFRIFKDNNGKLGTVYAAAIFDEKLFLGTNQGLFHRNFNTEGDFELIPQTKGQVWNLKVYDEHLFVCHNIGTFILDNQLNVVNLIEGQGTWKIQEIDSSKDLLLQGNYNGLSVLEKKNGQWVLRNRISGFDVSSKYFGLFNKNKIFVNHEYKGVYNLTVDDSLTKISNVEIDSNLEKGLNSSLTKYDGDIYYAFKNGVFKYDGFVDTFRKDSVLSQFYNNKNYLSGKLINDPMNSQLWGFTSNEIVTISKGQLSEAPIINRIPVSNDVRQMMIGYENILNVGANSYLIGTSSGYILMNTDKIKTEQYDIAINSIENFNATQDRTQFDQSGSAQLKNDWANISFTYSVPEYKKFYETYYQYQLEGIYEDWSNWSKESNVIFENLPFGDYTFKVRAKVGNEILNSEASYSFKVNKPWHATNLAIIAYALIVILFSIFMHYIYKSYYKRQKQKLIFTNKRDLELKELENEQQVMQLRNEKLKQDIDNKNRELAISTMSLIKKNEFLSNIKEELKNSDIKKGLNPVIKIIDKNINNNDDWKFFQEAFNNADKDFLKKVKSIHPKLTPNDLKLCAYLRLNLTSKEIAPLLNISPRSVEVKRYRLRKKMNLDHQDGLTDYILNI